MFKYCFNVVTRHRNFRGVCCYNLLECFNSSSKIKRGIHHLSNKYLLFFSFDILLTPDKTVKSQTRFLLASKSLSRELCSKNLSRIYTSQLASYFVLGGHSFHYLSITRAFRTVSGK